MQSTGPSVLDSAFMVVSMWHRRCTHGFEYRVDYFHKIQSERLCQKYIPQYILKFRIKNEITME